jgi:hypothetical protein
MPDFRQWTRACQNDTLSRLRKGTAGETRAAG